MLPFIFAYGVASSFKEGKNGIVRTTAKAPHHTIEQRKTRLLKAVNVPRVERLLNI
jgi:hypothetical protein